MKNVSCIIPAYNEEARIGIVLQTVSKSSYIKEIIVVDDCSTDNTAEVVKKFSHVKLLSHSKNEGKSKAVYHGIQNASGDFILLLDADLTGLTPSDIDLLIEPVIKNKVDVSISLRGNAPLVWRIIGIDYISGERVFPRSFFDHHMANIEHLSGFALEVFFNKLLIDQKSNIAIVRWKNVSSPYKYRKYGWIKGVRADTRMMIEIFKTISPLSAVKQIYIMRKRSTII
ncbi:MAG TPA: glycosyltransferase family 2 protein [Candidatus Paceibacterota bacterium]|nr:glycosyltransferase family 2 protein [Candidatus Paceibacterota bacterium]